MSVREAGEGAGRFEDDLAPGGVVDRVATSLLGRFRKLGPVQGADAASATAPIGGGSASDAMVRGGVAPRGIEIVVVDLLGGPVVVGDRPQPLITSTNAAANHHRLLISLRRPDALDWFPRISFGKPTNKTSDKGKLSGV